MTKQCYPLGFHVMAKNKTKTNCGYFDKYYDSQLVFTLQFSVSL